MLHLNLQSICSNIKDKSVMVYSLRSLLIHIYKYQMIHQHTCWNVFNAFFKFERDAHWCRRQIECIHRPNKNTIIWPPILKAPTTLPPDTLITLVIIHGGLHIPLIPIFMDQKTFKECLSMYIE
jgi:hypothetical protein